MKAEIIEGQLTIIPENETENFAINKWFDSHADWCSRIMKPLDLRKDIAVGRILMSEATPISIVKDKELHPNQKIALLNTLFKDRFTLADAERIVNNSK